MSAKNFRMKPTDFPESNQVFGPPKGMTENQVRSIPAFVTTIQGGGFDGTPAVIVAWKPTEEELIQLASGNPIFITMLGGLMPHHLSTSFPQASALSS